MDNIKISFGIQDFRLCNVVVSLLHVKRIREEFEDLFKGDVESDRSLDEHSVLNLN